MQERSPWPPGDKHLTAGQGLLQLQGKIIPSFLHFHNCLTLELFASTLLQLQQQEKPFPILPKRLQRKVVQMH